jgi:hypothetical protein
MPISQIVTNSIADDVTVKFADGSASTPSITNTGDTNTGMFFPAADTIAFSEGGVESMRIDSAGFVGIGTNSPATKLHVNTTTGGVQVRATSDTDVSFSATATAADSTAFMTVINDARQWTMRVNGAESDQFQVRDSTAGATRMVIDSSGNVGIGTASPNARLHVSSTSNTPAIVQASNAEAYLKLTSTGGSSYIGTKTNSIEFLVNNAGNYAASIDSSGNLLVGAAGTSANPRTVLYGGSSAGFIDLARTGTSLNDVINFSNGNGVVGTIRTTGSATQYNTNSDYRLKENIAPMTGALDVVLRQRPVTYKWKVDGTDGQGFIAHWLQEDGAGGCVSGEKDAVQLVDIKDEEGNVIGQEEKPVYQGIDTSFLVATLTAAIQELKAEFDAYKASHP